MKKSSGFMPRGKSVKRRLMSVLCASAAVTVCWGAIASAEPVETRCIRTSLIHKTNRSADGTFVDFDLRSGGVYRNTLRQRCPALRNSSFGYKTPTGHLCSGDTIRLSNGRGTCVLGPFVQTSGL